MKSFTIYFSEPLTRRFLIDLLDDVDTRFLLYGRCLSLTSVRFFSVGDIEPEGILSYIQSYLYNRFDSSKSEIIAELNYTSIVEF